MNKITLERAVDGGAIVTVIGDGIATSAMPGFVAAAMAFADNPYGSEVSAQAFVEQVTKPAPVSSPLAEPAEDPRGEIKTEEPAEKPKRCKRRTKAQIEADKKAAEEAKKAQKEPLPDTGTPPPPATESVAAVEEPAKEEAKTEPEPAKAEEAPADAEIVIKDSDLNIFAARVASHLGNAQPIYELAEGFVEGKEPRPTNIEGGEKRLAFIRKAEALTEGAVKFNG